MAPKGKTSTPKALAVDYSALEAGMKLQAWEDGVYYAAEVIEVSRSSKRAKAPVKVRFLGYDEQYNTWLGADRLLSKALKPKGEGKKEDKPKKANGQATGKGPKEPAKEKKQLEVEMGYWNIRGLGAVLRMILEYKQVKYVDKQFDSMEGWFKEKKPEILEKNPLANLPYIVSGNVCVCQTNAVLNYLGMRLRMSGQFMEQKLKNDQLLCEIYDTRNAMIDLVYPFRNINTTEDSFKENAAKILEKPYAKYEAWLAKYETDFFSGQKPCTADFHIWEMFDQHKLLATKMGKPDPLESTPKCKAFYDRFRALPTLQNYFESDAYKLPCNNPSAKAWFV